MVCSKHFVDGKPTSENPMPTLNLGYEKPTKVPRRKLLRESPPLPRRMTTDESQGGEGELYPYPSCDHDYHCLSEICGACSDKNKVLNSMASEISKLNKEKEQLQIEIQSLNQHMEKLTRERKSSKPFSATVIKSDRKMRFYTGIQSVAVFNALFSLVKPHILKLNYWRGNRVLCSKARNKSRLRTKPNKLHGKDQLLLVLMKLRLGLLNEDLADRFQISVGTCSSIFCTLVKFLSQFFGDALITWLPKEVVRSNLPVVFAEKNKNVRCIIDCSEVYIERPKSVDIQAATWSDYKQHNAFKFLIAVSPAGYIMFLSEAYGGRTTDKHICQDSPFYNLLEPGDEVMADRGFQIKEDLLYHRCTLSVPPGARVKSQFSTDQCTMTKEIANLRIHVERAINRLKTFRILKTTFPLTMLPLADDIVRVCAVICNIQRPLIRD